MLCCFASAFRTVRPTPNVHVVSDDQYAMCSSNTTTTDTLLNAADNEYHFEAFLEMKVPKHSNFGIFMALLFKCVHTM